MLTGLIIYVVSSCVLSTLGILIVRGGTSKPSPIRTDRKADQK